MIKVTTLLTSFNRNLPIIPFSKMTATRSFTVVILFFISFSISYAQSSEIDLAFLLEVYEQVNDTQVETETKNEIFATSEVNYQLWKNVKTHFENNNPGRTYQSTLDYVAILVSDMEQKLAN